jgi:hypothetical protein
MKTLTSDVMLKVKTSLNKFSYARRFVSHNHTYALRTASSLSHENMAYMDAIVDNR